MREPEGEKGEMKKWGGRELREPEGEKRETKKGGRERVIVTLPELVAGAGV